MAQTYLLTTSDGEEVHVETSQAGETITTPSGKTIEVPTLRELKKLPVVQGNEGPQGREWSNGQSVCLVIGLLLFLGCLVSSVYLYRITPLESLDKATEVPVELIEGDVSQWNMEQTLSFWTFATSDNALSQMRGGATGERYALDVYKGRQTFLLLSVIGVVVGLVLMGVAFVIPGRVRS
ncbi:hypothetical protein ACYFX5_15275 [Bremerella sp. T1]|uniref:hypothetical protein n=1 Tax=Bremerella sp. TYQ1 TaxID=3119568 RepID=UPI001CCFDE73|nr:hypothetical protein [Bremerella volcania]UBM34418.1 hypothetical protein LA756_17225 [Bremerella volcania]